MPLPAPAKQQPDWADVRRDLIAALSSKRKLRGSALLADTDQGRLHFGPQFVTLAWQCASTFRATDFLGGCNGARIRFPPEKDWAGNGVLVDSVLASLQPIKAKYPDITWSDLIVLAGTVAVEQAMDGLPAKQQAQQQQKQEQKQQQQAVNGVNDPFSFCPGRTDASSGAGSEILQPRNYSDPNTAFRDNAAVLGLTLREAVVLSARPRRCVVSP
jgi:catalase (peroxidase I)